MKVYRQFGIRAALMVGAAMLATAAAAQEAPAPAAHPEAAAGEGEAIGDIVVTAQRRSESVRKVPITIVAQTGAELARSGISNMRDLNQVVPGLNFTAQGPFAQPNLRGVSTTLTAAGADSPIAIYLDGLYQPNQQGNIFDLPDVERIEVLKGPQGTLFGRNATGGAISVTTKSPSFKPEGEFTVTEGLYVGNNVKTSNHLTAKGYVSGPITDTLAASIAGFYENTAGYLTNDLTGKRAGNVDAYIVRAKLRFEPSSDIRFLLSAYAGRRNDHAGNTMRSLNGVTISSFFPDVTYSQHPWHVVGELKDSEGISKTKSRGASLKSEFDIGGIGTLTSLTGYSYVNGLVVSDIDGTHAPSCVAAFACITPYVVYYGPSRTFQQELNFASEQIGDVRFVGGLFYYRDNSHLDSEVNNPLVGGKPQPGAPFFTASQVKTKALAAFGELTWDASEALHVTGGLRYSWERKRGVGSLLGSAPFDFGGGPSWDAWTPRISVRYDIDSRTNVYATYSKGFKSGVLESVNLSNDVAQPETLTSYEIGVKYGSPNASLSVSAFYYDYKDLQVQFYLGLGTVLGNASKAKIYGFDIDGSLRLSDSLTIRAAGSWLPHAKYGAYPNGVAFDFPLTAAGLQQVQYDASGDRLLKTPKFSGNLTLNYNREMLGGKVDGNATLYYSSSYKWELTGRVKTHGYATLNSQIGYTPEDSRWRFGIYGRNLTNKAYVVATTISNEGDAGAYAPPREIGVSLGYKF
ncbi:TonB-dependent receptor [Rhizorhabdus dicambivorans]|uniref:TonB-dependent receptor n=1 Tax=Rhizorhabdus dicambivorans TaxID=1850238 RepID=A0A2A4FWG4_9SPHN|nr:TonB-dependent receptor [Rhizorhabdus dicambivorans]ATE66209.1 TonB-dependent receptor [Rhizorhabdus dicambivorans]PCE41721.1 TonB-dependent receptor [Rhizorhabdus dicambivorans]